MSPAAHGVGAAGTRGGTVALPASERGFFAALALVFAVSLAITVFACASWSAMPMCGGGTMAMAWLPRPGQTWPGAAASFLGMWIAMMIAMMLPSLTPALSQYRRAIGRPDETRLGLLTALVGLGYFAVWAAFGLVAFALGGAWAAFSLRLPALAHAAPAMQGVVVLIAGLLQFTSWKMRALACCRTTAPRMPADAETAWRHGLHLGLHCCYCCASPTAALLASGIMDLRAMGAVAAMITAERLAPAGERVARAIGVVAVGGGLLLIARAAAIG